MYVIPTLLVDLVTCHLRLAKKDFSNLSKKSKFFLLVLLKDLSDRLFLGFKKILIAYFKLGFDNKFVAFQVSPVKLRPNYVCALIIYNGHLYFTPTPLFAT